MNILPKKKFHVKNKDNVAKVNADVAKYKEEEFNKQHKVRLAEQEFRTEFLRSKKSNEKLSESDYNADFANELREDKAKFDKKFYDHNKLDDKLDVESWYLQSSKKKRKNIDEDRNKKEDIKKLKQDPIHRMEILAAQKKGPSLPNRFDREDVDYILDRCPNDIVTPMSSQLSTESPEVRKMRLERKRREQIERERVAKLMASKMVKR